MAAAQNGRSAAQVTSRACSTPLHPARLPWPAETLAEKHTATPLDLDGNASPKTVTGVGENDSDRDRDRDRDTQAERFLDREPVT